MRSKSLKNKCVYSGKIIGNKDAVLVEYIVEGCRMMGHHVIRNKTNLFFITFSILLALFSVMAIPHIDENFYTYDNQTQKATFKNALNEVQTEVTLIKSGGVIEGKDRNVLTFNITNYNSDYIELGNMDILNMKNSKYENKNFQLKYLNQYEELNSMETRECEKKEVYKNGSFYNEDINCIFVNFGTYFSKVSRWETGKIRVNKGQSLVVGLFTDVDKGDYYDGIPYINISGEIHKVTEMGIWQESFQNSLIAYYNTDHNISNQMTDSYRGKYNLTIKAGTPVHLGNDSAKCIASGCINFGGTASYRTNTFGSVNTSTPISISFWTRKNSNVGNKRFIATGPDSGVGAFLVTDASISGVTPAVIHSYAFGSDWDYPNAMNSFGTLSNLQWYHIAVVWDGTKGNNPSYKLYVDGRYFNWSGNGGEDLITDFATTIFTVGGWEDKDYVNARISNVGVWHRELTDGGCSSDVSDNNVTCGGEISDLYNNHYPIEYEAIDTSPPQIEIKTPLNQTYTTNNLYINVSSDEDIGTCLYSFNNFQSNTTMSSLNSTYYYHNNNTIPEGNLKLQFFCNDTIGNANNSETVEFKADYSGPIINITDQTIGYNQSLYYIVSSYDLYSTISSYQINNTNNFSIDIDNGTLINITGLGLGSYFINITVNDSLNNYNSAIMNLTIINNTVVLPDSNAVWDLDLNSNTTMIIILILFAISGIFVFVRRSEYASGIIIILGFILLFNSFSVALSFLIICIGVGVAFIR